MDLNVNDRASDNLSVASFQPRTPTANRRGPRWTRRLLNTGDVQPSGTFTIDPENDEPGHRPWHVSSATNPANWGVCRTQFTTETTESPNTERTPNRRNFYIINAGVLSYHVPDASYFAAEDGDATAYFMNSFATRKDCPLCAPQDGARAGHFRMEFGTTVLAGAMSQTDAGTGTAAVTVQPIPDVTIKFDDVTGSGSTNVVKTTDATTPRHSRGASSSRMGSSTRSSRRLRTPLRSRSASRRRHCPRAPRRRSSTTRARQLPVRGSTSQRPSQAIRRAAMSPLCRRSHSATRTSTTCLGPSSPSTRSRSSTRSRLDRWSR